MFLPDAAGEWRTGKRGSEDFFARTLLPRSRWKEAPLAAIRLFGSSHSWR